MNLEVIFQLLMCGFDAEITPVVLYLNVFKYRLICEQICNVRPLEDNGSAE